jgi:hypothetical protein
MAWIRTALALPRCKAPRCSALCLIPRLAGPLWWGSSKTVLHLLLHCATLESWQIHSSKEVLLSFTNMNDGITERESLELRAAEGD